MPYLYCTVCHMCYVDLCLNITVFWQTTSILLCVLPTSVSTMKIFSVVPVCMFNFFLVTLIFVTEKKTKQNGWMVMWLSGWTTREYRTECQVLEIDQQVMCIHTIKYMSDTGKVHMNVLSAFRINIYLSSYWRAAIVSLGHHLVNMLSWKVQHWHHDKKSAAALFIAVKSNGYWITTTTSSGEINYTCANLTHFIDHIINTVVQQLCNFKDLCLLTMELKQWTQSTHTCQQSTS